MVGSQEQCPQQLPAIDEVPELEDNHDHAYDIAHNDKGAEYTDGKLSVDLDLGDIVRKGSFWCKYFAIS